MSPESHPRRGPRAVPDHPQAERTPGPGTDAWQGIDVSPDVVRALGAATVMRLRADPTLREYVCTICDQPGLITRPDATDPDPADQPGPASLVVLTYANGLTAVSLAHAECSPSAVLRILRAPTRLGHRVRATCWLRPTASGATSALLLIDNQVRAWRRTQMHDPGDDYTRAVEAAGFTNTTDLDQPPPAVPGLQATITLDPDVELDEAALYRQYDERRVDPQACEWTQVQVTHPDGVLFDGVLSAPHIWVAKAREHGTVTVVTGTKVTPVPLPDVPGGHVTPQVLAQAQQFLDGVAAAVAAGRAWTGVATLTTAGDHTRPHPNPDTEETSPGPDDEVDNEGTHRIPWRRLLGIRRSTWENSRPDSPSAGTAPGAWRMRSAARHIRGERAG
jgi:hypothetical protein